MYRIGMFSQLGKTTIKTLRYYEEAGLLRPAHTDADSGYRYYTTDQLFQLHRIQSLRQMGCSIVEIAAILDGRQVEEIIQKRKADVEQQLAGLDDQLSRLNNYLNNRKEGFMMNYQAVLKEVPACTVFSKRMTIPDYSALMQVVPAIGQAISAANPGLKCAEPEYCFNIYHDGEYREKDIDVEVCEAVTCRGKEVDGIVFKDIPAATVVATLHKGPYQDLGAAYAFVFQWIEDNGYTVTDRPRESYIDGIWNKESEADWLTEIQVPVRKG